jgi:hypothetical protein
MSEVQQMGLDQPVRQGMGVYSLDKRPIGTVHAVASGAFCVDISDEFVWLRRDAIYAVEFGQITLICNGQSVNQYRAAAGPPIR